MTSIILAGGKSSRLGRSKTFEPIGGKSLIQWVIDHLAVLSTEIIIATAHGEKIPYASAVRIKMVADVYPGKGPLVGIYSGLIASSSPRAIVVGCDMPFLSDKKESRTSLCGVFQELFSFHPQLTRAR
jgi:molybdopterin-guanine dinucleotide biosynthesis protein A